MVSKMIEELPNEVINLGILAAQCELMAEEPQNAATRPYLLLKADDYRTAQAIMLLEHNQKTALPYVHANVLGEGPNTSELPHPAIEGIVLGLLIFSIVTMIYIFF